MNEKIPVYNIINMFFVGAVFTIVSALICHEYLPFEWIKENSDMLADWSILISAVLLIVMYEVGFIINRLGSIVVEPIYKYCRIWPKDTYGADVSELSQSNSRVQSMITELVLMRSHIMMSLLLIVPVILCTKWYWCVINIALIMIFTFGGRKHNAKINIIRKSYREQTIKQEQNQQARKEEISNFLS